MTEEEIEFEEDFKRLRDWPDIFDDTLSLEE